MKKPDTISLLYILAITGFLIGSAIILSWNIADKKPLPPVVAGTGSVIPTPTETPEYYIEEAKSYITTERPLDAIRSYQFALGLAPQNPTILEELVKLHLQVRDFASATVTATTLVSTNPDSPTYHALLIESKLKHAKSAEEIGMIFQEASNLTKSRPTLGTTLQHFNCLAAAYALNSQTVAVNCTGENAVEQKILEQTKLFQTFKDGNPAYLAAMVAKTLMEHQYFSLAQIMLEPLTEKNPEYRDIHTLLGFAYFMQNNLPAAKASLSIAYNLDTTRSDIQYMLGMVYEQLGDAEQALRYYTIALSNQYPKQDELRAKIASFHIAKQEYDKALLHYTKLIEGTVSTPEYFTTPVWIYIEVLKDPLQALAYAKSARALFPDSAITINLLGWAYLANGDLEQAKELFLLAISKDARYAPPYLNMGLYHVQKGSNEEARSYFNQAIAKDPASAVAERAREQLRQLP